jgi:hypothetical protein
VPANRPENDQPPELEDDADEGGGGESLSAARKNLRRLFVAGGRQHGAAPRPLAHPR